MSSHLNITLPMVKVFKGEEVRPAWLKNFGKILDIKEISTTKTETMFLTYLDNGIMVNLVTLKDKDNKFILDRIGGELDSTYKDEG